MAREGKRNKKRGEGNRFGEKKKKKRTMEKRGKGGKIKTP